MIRRFRVLALSAMLLSGATASLAATSPSAVDLRDEAPVNEPVREPAARRTEPAAAPERAVPSRNPLWAIPLRTLSATRERPLFSPSRRPAAVVVPPAYQAAPAPPPPPPRPAEPEKPQFSLVGTVAGEAHGIGVFVEGTAKTVLRLKTGDQHQGWILRTVRRREVVLQKGSTTTVLALPVPSPGKAVPVPPAASSAAVAVPATMPVLPGSAGQPRRGWVPPPPQLGSPAPPPTNPFQRLPGSMAVP